MSEYVVHFTKPNGGFGAWDVLARILECGVIEARNSFGAARQLGALHPTQQCTCYSEIPLDRLDRLVERRSPYGIGFNQEVLLRRGGARVWYLDRDTPVQQIAYGMTSVMGGIDPADPIWRLTPFIDYPGDYGGTDYRFEWEREWRLPGDLDFEVDEVSFLLAPAAGHDELRARFGWLPASLVDTTWSDAQIQTTLDALP
jgi:hypothetical protein